MSTATDRRDDVSVRLTRISQTGESTVKLFCGDDVVLTYRTAESTFALDYQ